MNDKQATQKPELFSSSNSIILNIIQNDGFDDEGAINQLEHWAKNCRYNTRMASSGEEIAKIQASILREMEAVLKILLLLDKDFLEIDKRRINKICQTGFFIMLTLLDRNTQTKIKKRLGLKSESGEIELDESVLDYSVLEKCLAKKHEILNQPYFGLRFFNNQFFTPNVDVIDVYSNILPPNLPNLIKTCEESFEQLKSVKSQGEWSKILKDGIENFSCQKEKMNYILIMMEKVLYNYGANYWEYRCNAHQKCDVNETRKMYSDQFSIMFNMLDVDIQEKFSQKLIEIKSKNLSNLSLSEVEFDHNLQFLRSCVNEIKKALSDMLGGSTGFHFNDDNIKCFESYYDKFNALNSEAETSEFVGEVAEILQNFLSYIGDSIEGLGREHFAKYCMSALPQTIGLSEDLSTFNFFKDYFEKKNNTQIFTTIQCIKSIKNVEYHDTCFVDNASFPPMTAYFDSSFLENLLRWEIQPIEKINHSYNDEMGDKRPNYRFSISTQKNAKIENSFSITMYSKNETFINLENLSIEINFRCDPFPAKTFKLLMQALESKNIPCIHGYKNTLQIRLIENKEKLFSIMEIINHFAKFNKNDYEKLDSIIGFIDPASKIHDLIELESYDLAIEEARLAEKKGYKDCVWNTAKKLENSAIYDKALQVYNSIDHDSPHYKEAKLKCRDILVMIMSPSYSRDFSDVDKMEYREYLFQILLEIFEFDPSPENQKWIDGLFSALCGQIRLNLSFNDVKLDSKTFLHLARELRKKEEEISGLKKEIKLLNENNNQSLKSTEKKSSCSSYTQGFFAHSQGLIQESSTNSEEIKGLLQACYKIPESCIISITCSDNFLEIKLQNTINFKKTLSKCKNVSYDKDNRGFRITNEEGILKFVETLKSQHRYIVEQASMQQDNSSGLSLQ